ncbi:MAG: hypothetical protein AABX07_03855 [Nanoarchaeota archaeon]
MDNCITCSSLRCSSPDRKLRTKCATSYAVFCIRILCTKTLNLLLLKLQRQILSKG